MLGKEKIRNKVFKFFGTIFDEERSLAYNLIPNLKKENEREFYHHFVNGNLFVVTEKLSVKKLASSSKSNVVSLKKKFKIIEFDEALAKTKYNIGDVQIFDFRESSFMELTPYKSLLPFFIRIRVLL